MTRKFRKIYIFTLFSLVFFIPTISFSADISIDAKDKVKLGDSFEVTISFDSDGILVNSANIILDYDESKLTFSGYKSQNSVIGIWVESPNDKDGRIHMSGIIPGGVSGLYDPRKEAEQGLGATPLVSLLFSARKEGDAKFSFTQTDILKHDGYGTKLPHTQSDKQISITNDASIDSTSLQENIIADREKPSPFEVVFVESSALSKTPSLIVFKAEDVGSGIKEYKMNTGGSRWIDIKSPWPVSKGIFPKTITIRAYDFAGNFEDGSIYIKGFLPAGVLSAVFILFVLLCFIAYKMIKYRRNET